MSKPIEVEVTFYNSTEMFCPQCGTKVTRKGIDKKDYCKKCKLFIRYYLKMNYLAEGLKGFF